MKILITCFLPFNKSPNNYSIEVAKLLNSYDRMLVDVSYDDCFEEIKRTLNIDEYDYIIALGEARSRKEILVEKRALNIQSCSIPDNAGVIKLNEVIINDNNEYLETNIDLHQFKDIINISTDCGKFVCNTLYYKLLYWNPNKSLFIHIPECNNDLDEYFKYKSVIEKIIEILKEKND